MADLLIVALFVATDTHNDEGNHHHCNGDTHCGTDDTRTSTL